MIEPKEQDVLRRKQILLDIMPEYYRESPEVDAIMHGNAWEIERKRAEAQDLLDQMFVSTATWGMDYWDRVLDLEQAPRMSIKRRRERIVAKLREAAPATIKYLTSLVNSFVPSNDAYIEERAKEHSFNAVIPAGSEINTSDIYAAIEEVKPAHLDFGIQALIKAVLQVITKQYIFPVPYPATGTFHTASISGVASKATVEAESKTYAHPVPYLITGTFYCSEGGY